MLDGWGEVMGSLGIWNSPRGSKGGGWEREFKDSNLRGMKWLAKDKNALNAKYLTLANPWIIS